MKHDKQERQVFPRKLFWAFVCLLIIAGCATSGSNQTPQPEHAAAGILERRVLPGDTASVNYLCRLRSGEIAAATDVGAEKIKKSNIYMQQEQAGPILITASSSADDARMQEAPYVQRSLEEEISILLSHAMVGMKEGESRTIEIKAENAPPREAHKFIARMARVRTRPKEMKMPTGDYEYRTQRAPEIGQEYSYDPSFPGRVASVSENEVTIRFSATPGAVIETPFGPGRVREEGQNYKVDIDAHKGTLVRAASMVGRVSDVDDKVITVDFGNPFGGETLACDVTVEKITDAKLVQSGK